MRASVQNIGNQDTAKRDSKDCESQPRTKYDVCAADDENRQNRAHHPRDGIDAYAENGTQYRNGIEQALEPVEEVPDAPHYHDPTDRSQEPQQPLLRPCLLDEFVLGI